VHPLVAQAQDVVETEAEVLYARDREWAMTTEDVLRRRTTLARTGRGTSAVRDRVEALLGS
jgi:glycerol-3-phosphate dehydrogenase